MSDNLVIAPDNGNTSKMNVFQRVISAVFSPGRLMYELEQKPRVLLGIILTAIAPAIMMLGTFPMFKEYLRTTLEATYANMGMQISPEMFENILNGSVISTPVIGGVMAGLILLVEALVVWLVLKIFKGQGRFKQVLSVMGYSSVITVLGAIVSVIAIQLTGTYSDVTYTSLAAFMPDMKGSFIFGAARSLDVFNIWYFVCASIGVATVSKVDNKKAYLVMVILLIVIAAFGGYNEVKSAALLN